MTTELDMPRVEEFAGRLFGYYIGAGLASMVDIGHRTGLFEAMAGAPGTSDEIAAQAGLSERHVREWLGAITTAGTRSRRSTPSASRARRRRTWRR